MPSIAYKKQKSVSILTADNFLSLAVFLTIISQMPFLRVIIGIDTQVIIFPVWALTLIVGLLFKGRIIFNKKSSLFLLLVVLFVFLILAFEIFTGNSYVANYVTYPLYVTLLIYLVGLIYSSNVSSNCIQKIAYSYVLACLFLTIDILLEYFIGYSFATARYTYSSKNSASIIVLSGIIFTLYFIKPKRPFWKFTKLLLLVIFVALIVYTRSRAALVSLLVIPVLYLFSSKTKNKNKIILLLLLSLFVALVLLNRNVYNFLVKNILLKSTSDSINWDLDYVTSNRYSQITEAWSIFSKSNIFVGSGFYYVDCFYLNALVNYGLIAGIILVLIALCPIMALDHIVTKAEKITYVSIVAVFLVNGFFEGLAPFGPGSKCFILWILFGVFSGIKRNPSEFRMQ